MTTIRSVRLSPAALVLALLLAGGCSAARGPAASNGGTSYGDGSIRVLVDGKDQGGLPATVMIHRSFGTHMVSLWRGDEQLRSYELLRSHTADDVQLAYSFWAGAEGDEVVYDVSVLAKDGEDQYYVPFSRGRIRVEDRQYRLVLVVDE